MSPGGDPRFRILPLAEPAAAPSEPEPAPLAPDPRAPDPRAPDPRGPGTRRRPLFSAAVVAVLLAVTGALFYRWGSAGAATPRTAAASPSPSASALPSTPAIYAAVAPSVVSIQASHAGGADAGTGVVVNADGTILTAFHVVRGADAIKLTFADGTTSPATVTATDPTSDIAALAPASLPSVLVPAVLGRSDQLAVGDSVVVIGDQLGLTRTATTGVVSGLGRAATTTENANLSGLIQFDAAVNPGSSGGPLLNGKGQVVGIVVALANPTDAGTFIGVGFAVPITTAVAAQGGNRAPQQ